MENLPTISIFRSSGGQPVAKGVLIWGKGGPAGLFRPWPGSLVADEEFSVYIPESGGHPAKWLTPDRVGILQDVDDQDRPLGIISFMDPPSKEEVNDNSFDQEAYEKSQNEDRSLWYTMKAARGITLKRLADLEISSPTGQDSSTLGEPGQPQNTAKPQVTLAAMATDVQPYDFFCRYLLRMD